jgi:hypothetical protein
MCDLEHEALLGEHPPVPCINGLRYEHIEASHCRIPFSSDSTRR